jgi:rhamnosyl/mannosyltransferase
MRVLQLGKYYHPYLGGIETHLYDLCMRLVRSHDVEAVVCNTQRRTVRERVDGVYVTRVGSLGRSSSTEFCPTLPFELSARTYDVLHLHAPNPMGMLAYVAARKPPQHYLVVTHHSDIIRQTVLRKAFVPLFHAVMSRADRIIATSSRYLETSSELERYLDKCVVIPFGIDTKIDRPVSTERVRELRARFGVRVVLFVGRLIYYKGLQFLIEAMRAVRGSLLVIGDGPLRAQIEEQIRSLGLQDRIFLLGNVSKQDLPSYYAAADVFAFPSVARSEAFGVAQLEAMLAGLPVVNTVLDSGVPEVSVHGETGLSVPVANARAFAVALECLLDSPELRRRYGEAGRRRVGSSFDADVMASRVSQLYRETVQDSSRRVA